MPGKALGYFLFLNVPCGNWTHNWPLGGVCYIHLTKGTYFHFCMVISWSKIGNKNPNKRQDWDLNLSWSSASTLGRSGKVDLRSASPSSLKRVSGEFHDRTGIWTQGSFLIVGFQDRCNKPLCHPAKKAMNNVHKGMFGMRFELIIWASEARGLSY